MNIDSMPKQFLPLGSKPIFMHTLEKFLLCDQFDAVYLGVHGDWVDFVEDALSTAGLADAPVRVVKGGADRNGTIMSIIEGIEREFGESDEHVIVTHDSVRPFVKLSTIRANIDAMA
ncbi:MAG: 2-C-methyl-D-erythritol 4-phosphate cytidylyltransferase, partial [Eggerthellaceae bacterium]